MRAEKNMSLQISCQAFEIIAMSGESIKTECFVDSNVFMTCDIKEYAQSLPSTTIDVEPQITVFLISDCFDSFFFLKREILRGGARAKKRYQTSKLIKGSPFI